MKPHRFRTIAEFLAFRKLPKPEHPLITVLNIGALDRRNWSQGEPVSQVFDFYSVALKRNFPAKVKYGQQVYDFDEGVMSFIAPGQVFGVEPVPDAGGTHSGWMLMFHPDFLWNSPLSQTIRDYRFFDYSVNEALFLSDKEETTVTGVIQAMEGEYHANIDAFTQGILVSQIEVLLSYCQRFYHRQFLTRQITNHRVLDKLEALLAAYFEGDTVARLGLPTVQYVADQLNLSSHYLSELLTVLTGQSTQQHIHDRLIAQAKQELSTTDLTVSEIAYRLGFEHSQSFSKLFKKKTNVSPLEFRKAVSS